MKRYYLIVDSGTQWFSRIICIKDDREISESLDLQTLEPQLKHNSSLFSNIYGRKPLGVITDEFGNKLTLNHYSFGSSGNISLWHGWSISEFEFEKIKKLIELTPYVKKFNELLN